ncbi:MAG: PilZ domain-containing protein, partial [Planctomycetes bacterium]|nr:PilZ domain-containing protein [Planctomycetota bacterium]
PFVRLIRMPRTAPPSLIRGATSGDLRRSIADIIQGIGGKVQPPELDNLPELSPHGDLVTHKFVAGLPVGSARLKLESFTNQWLGQCVRDDESGPVIRIGLPTNRWQRWLRGAPALEITVRLSRVQFRSATPIEVTIEIRAPGIAPAQGRKFLEDMSPLLLDSLRNLLVVNSEKRTQERLSWPQPVKITPVLPDGEHEPTVECRGKDISLAGLGFYLPHELHTTEVLIELPNPFHPPSLCIPATLVRANRCADGWYDVGALFRLAALRQTSQEVQMAR